MNPNELSESPSGDDDSPSVAPSLPTTATEIYNHLIETVLGFDDEHPLSLALKKAGCVDIYDLESMDFATIDGLQYPVKENNKWQKRDVPVFHLNALKCLLEIPVYLRVYAPVTQQFGMEDWRQLTRAQFNAYRTMPDFTTLHRSGTLQGLNTPSAPTPPVHHSTAASGTPSAAPAPTNRYTPVELFLKGVRRDVTAFPVLSDDRLQHNWHISLKSQAAAQHLENVLDTSYVPSTLDDKLLFVEQQKFMFAVFEKTLKTDKGLSLVKEHAIDRDAQQLYAKLLTYHTESTKAADSASHILNFLMTVRLGGPLWRSTTEKFLLNWQIQVSQYNSLVPRGSELQDHIKHTMLRNAVEPIDDLRTVQTAALVNSAQAGRSTPAGSV